MTPRQHKFHSKDWDDDQKYSSRCTSSCLIEHSECPKHLAILLRAILVLLHGQLKIQRAQKNRTSLHRDGFRAMQTKMFHGLMRICTCLPSKVCTDQENIFFWSPHLGQARKLVVSSDAIHLRTSVPKGRQPESVSTRARGKPC